MYNVYANMYVNSNTIQKSTQEGMLHAQMHPLCPTHVILRTQALNPHIHARCNVGIHKQLRVRLRQLHRLLLNTSAWRAGVCVCMRVFVGGGGK